jgi:DNA-binding CsgD family transcriptional regulator
MLARLTKETKLAWGLIVLIVAQVFCALFFGADVLADYLIRGTEQGGGEPQWHLAVEFVATLSLWAAIVFEVRYIRGLLRRKAQLERSVSIASSAMQDVIDAFMTEWSLTAAERDVANLMIKGLTIGEIAEARGSAEGTVKAQLNAIYRKSGTRNRGDLLSVIIENLLGNPERPRVEPG